VDAIDWGQTVHLTAVTDEVLRPGTSIWEGPIWSEMSLAAEVRMVVEDWKDQPTLGDNVWSNCDHADYVGVVVIRALYDLPDFPK
jgi:hypothetical protein